MKRNQLTQLALRAPKCYTPYSATVFLHTRRHGRRFYLSQYYEGTGVETNGQCNLCRIVPEYLRVVHFLPVYENNEGWIEKLKQKQKIDKSKKSKMEKIT